MNTARDKFLTEAMGEIKLLDGRVALIDPEDYEICKQYSWTVNDRGYVISWWRNNKKKGCIYLHRLLFDFPDTTVDHINHNKLDNRKGNLRVCTIRENNYNRPPNSNKMYSKLKGVSFDKRRGKFIAQIMFNGKNMNLGSFVSDIEAHKAYKLKAKELFGDYSYE